MKIESVAGFAPISSEPKLSLTFHKELFGLPLAQVKGDYFAMDGFNGVKHFGVWPLKDAARSCFNSEHWPSDIAVPSSTIEYELSDADAVREAVQELTEKGCVFIHGARLEPWGQTIARLLSPEGILVGLCYSPWLHEA